MLPVGSVPRTVRVLLIVNATASSVTPRRRRVIEQALRADHELTVAETKHRGHAARLAHGATTDGTELVVVLAGDGTLNETADGLRGSSVALFPMPGGSTNVYARMLGISEDPVDATAQILDAIDARSFRRISVGSANGRTFLFHCGVGFDAAVIRKVEARSALKRYAAHPLFVLTALQTWTNPRARAIRFTVELADGATVESAFLIVAKTSPWTYIGHRPIVITPEANLDSALSAVALHSSSANLLVRSFFSAISRHRFIDRSKHITHVTDIKRLTVHCPKGAPWQVDGDYLGEIEELAVELVPDALTILVPNPAPSEPDPEDQ